MFSLRTTVSSTILAILAVCFTVNAGAQIVIIDTIGYLPEYYRGAREYNLMIASSKGYTSEIERWLKLGANINATAPEGATPLMFAVANNQEESVRLLLENDADTEKAANDSKTPLLVAVDNGNTGIAEMLIRAGADIDHTDRNGATALHYAAVYGDFYMTDMLLYYFAQPDIKSRDGTTPLMAAILAEHADIADLLIQNGANMEARDSNGFTPLMIAAQNGDTVIMNLLIRKGVDVNAINRYNHDALAIAIMVNSTEAAELLIKSGASREREKNSVNPYKVAGAFRRKEIINILENNGISGKYNFGADQLSLSLSSKFTGYDMFTGIGFLLKEPYLNSGIIAGFDTKLWYTRILSQEDENTYFQYKDKRSIVYAGFFKDFSLTDRQFRGNYSVSVSLMASKALASKFKGTNITADTKFRIIPAVTLKWERGPFGLLAGAEYMNTGFYKIGPLWGRAGLSYSFFFNSERAPGKTIRWY